MTHGAENHPAKLQDFWERIGELRDEEVHKMKEGRPTTGHFASRPEFAPEHLTEDDMAIWERLEEKTLTREEFFAYRHRVMESKAKNPDDPVGKSRAVFQAFIANKASLLFAREDKERDKAARKTG